MSTIQSRLLKLDISIPELPPPAGAYLPTNTTGNIIYASGQTPVVNGKLVYRGYVGSDLTIEQGYDAARIACLNCLAELQFSLGDLGRIRKIIKVNGYVRSAPMFGDQPSVINGASDLLYQIFGEAGRHSRTAIGVYELPFGAPVEIELIAEFT